MAQHTSLKLKANKLKTERSWQDYKIIRNKVNENVKSSKIQYYNSYFIENFKNIQQAWKGFNEIPAKKPKSKLINNIKHENKNYNSSEEINTSLNSHFTEIGPKLASQLPPSRRDFYEYIKSTEHSFSIDQITNNEWNKLISALPLNKACGIDGISARLLKDGAPVVASSLTFIINLSIRTGIFKDDWKVAKVTPIYKEGDKTNPITYLPISVLPIVTKLIERVNFYQFYRHLTEHNLLSEAQSGFRPKHSTLTPLLDSTNEQYLNIEKGP